MQAPAGSGKTGLLTQRVLRLLAGVAEPEAILAITFTRKAAAEMRARVLEALHAAADQNTPPESDYQRQLWSLARAALEQNTKRGWRLLDNPQRLRMMTIDALCLSLAQRMPVLSRFGGPLGVETNPGALYREAAGAALRHASDPDGARREASRRVLAHLNGDVNRAEAMLARMLSSREQWLRHVVDGQLERAALEQAVEAVVRESLHALRAAVPRTLEREVCALARFAALNAPEEKATQLSAWRERIALPDADASMATAWAGLANLLLTQAGTWRRQVTKREGFPAASSGANAQQKALFKEMKARMLTLLERLDGDAELAERLDEARRLPPTRYEASQWEVLAALGQLMVMAAGYLTLSFAQREAVDFAEVSLSASRALGDLDNPSDLALKLDHALQHILVDEFQDTSHAQYRLLERLTAEWTPEDRRTLFLVGDPMQSIYRFREAEVGLFLSLFDVSGRTPGRLGGIELHPLQLTVNFRSRRAVVDWVNYAFVSVMPEEADVERGAAPFSRAACFEPPGAAPDPLASADVRLTTDAQDEARQAVALTQQALADFPEGQVAILARARPHLAAIAAGLKQAGIRYRAVEIEALANRPWILDMLALTRALLHRGDRVAWLSLLRAPWCGLQLADLHLLAGGDAGPRGCITEKLARWERLAGLSDDARARLARVWPVLSQALGASRRRGRLRDWLLSVWRALGGEACLRDARELADIDAYLNLLDQLEEGGAMPQEALLTERMASLFAAVDDGPDVRVQLMTIHKSKGLEFDCVIVPGLSRTPYRGEPELLQWAERPSRDAALLLAPIKRVGGDEDPLYAHLTRLERQKGAFEAGRLLYVAATRARRRLHLLGQAPALGESGEGIPANGSFLALLWPALTDEAAAQSLIWPEEPDADNLEPLDPLDPPSVPLQQLAPALSQTLARLPACWTPPPLADDVELPEQSVTASVEPDAEPVAFDWASETARLVGVAAHGALRRLAEVGVDAWRDQGGGAAQAAIERQLRALGAPHDELERAVAKCVAAIENCAEDPVGRWILDPSHEAARSEWDLTGVIDGKRQRMVVDRTFIDAEGARWIIDFKTGAHEGGDPQGFLDNEAERYRAQLEGYARLLRRLEPQRPIRVGLYFPLMRGWRHWIPRQNDGALP
ncbi:putative UvrD/REP helicase [Magnetofaba australis IT-1]|uniref:DNA 3'-5' helicase n=1 Tax=Magnetofaba australis IT-1 TaxID=1434232 RepID=A0A1Y2K6U6_9PROT|nr:putative UvrD/REP helicase [Magnetofaba australis IT-1]